MTDNNTTDYGDMSSVDLVDLLHTRDEQVSKLTVRVDKLRSGKDELDSKYRKLQTAVIDPIKQGIARGDTFVIESLDQLANLFEGWSGKSDFDFRAYRRRYVARREFSGSYNIEIETTDPDMTIEKLADLVDEHTVGSIDYEFISFRNDDRSIVIDQSYTYVDVDHDENFDLEEE